uniref:hypothetical protein n=1 Tax=Escherichia coli TaxID=562 RepID=UPI0019541E4B
TWAGAAVTVSIDGATGVSAASVLGKLATGTRVLGRGLCRSRLGCCTAGGGGMIAASRPITGLGV